MANLNIGASLNTVTTLANLPVDKGTVYATLSAASTISLASAMIAGQIVDVIIIPSANFTLPVPSTGAWSSNFGTSLKLNSGQVVKLTITCYTSGKYVITADGATYAKNSADGGGLNFSNGYEFVNLGYSRNILWATCNIGATKPEETGQYFKWGSVVGDSTQSVSGIPRHFLDLDHDAARYNMGGLWCMPTQGDFSELVSNTNYSLDTVNGIKGIRFASKVDNSKSIFIPAVGYYDGNYKQYEGYGGFLWTSDGYSQVYTQASSFSFEINIYSEYTINNHDYKLINCRLPIRPVLHIPY